MPKRARLGPNTRRAMPNGRPMSQFAGASTHFWTNSSACTPFRPQPRDARGRWRVARSERGRPRGPTRLRRPLGGRTAGDAGRRPVGGRADRPRPAALRAGRAAVRRDGPARGAWDALGYVYLLGSGIFPLLARDFAPLETRLASVAARLEGVPAVLAAARAELGSLPGRPASRLHTEIAIKQLSGIAALAGDAVAQAEAAADRPGVASVTPRLGAAAGVARGAIGEFEAFLRDDLLPRSSGDGRLGADLFARKLRHTFRSGLTADEILAQARVEYEAVRGEMVRIARGSGASGSPGNHSPRPPATAARRRRTSAPSPPSPRRSAGPTMLPTISSSTAARATGASSTSAGRMT